MNKSSTSLPRILVLGDSLSLPRRETPYDETWIGLLQEQRPGYQVIDRSERGASSFKLVTAGGGGIDTLELYSPDVSIIQMGVTESAPRLFKKEGFEHFFLNNLLPPSLRMKYVNRVKKRRLRSPEKADTPPEAFRSNISSYCRRASAAGTRVILFPIAPPSETLKAKSPFFENSINTYNGILRDIAGENKNAHFFDPYEKHSDLPSVWLDEIHFDKTFHHHVYTELVTLLDGLLKGS